MPGLNPADLKSMQFTATVTGTNHGEAVPDNNIRRIGVLKFSNTGAMSSEITLMESNAAGTSTKTLDKTYLNPGDNLVVAPSRWPIAVMRSGNSYLRSVVSSGEVDVTVAYADTY